MTGTAFNNAYLYGVTAVSYTGDATGVLVYAQYNAVVNGSGDFFTVASGDGAGNGGDATAIEAHGKYAGVDVSGFVYASAYYGDATGIYPSAGLGGTTVNSSGDLVVLTHSGGVSSPVATVIDVNSSGSAPLASRTGAITFIANSGGSTATKA